MMSSEDFLMNFMLLVCFNLFNYAVIIHPVYCDNYYTDYSELFIYKEHLYLD